MRHLKPNEVAEVRAELWLKQRKVCPLCGRYIRKDQAALDHDHNKGNCRSVLHKNCNGIEGRILQWAKRSGIAPKEFLQSLLAYWEQDYSDMPLHPNHLNDDQKLVKMYRKRMQRAKRPSTKAKYRNLIKELKAGEA